MLDDLLLRCYVQTCVLFWSATLVYIEKLDSHNAISNTKISRENRQHIQYNSWFE